MSGLAVTGMLVGGTQGLERGGPTQSEIYKGPDGKDRYWIDDRGARIKDAMKEHGSYKWGFYTLPQVLDHPELFKRYPQAADIKVKVHDVPAKTTEWAAAYFIPSENTLVINKSVMEKHYRPEQMDSMMIQTILHEVQHTIQKDEGTSFGSSPNQMREGLQELKKAAPEDYQRKIDLLESYVDDYLYRTTGQSYDKLSPQEKEEVMGDVAYWLLYGEQEARAVEKQYAKRRPGRTDKFLDYDAALVNDPNTPYGGVPYDLKTGKWLMSPEGQKALQIINQKLRTKQTPPVSGSIFEDPFAPTIE